MRRSDREIKDRDTIESFLSEQKILRIGLYDNGEIYIVPVNYGYDRSDKKYTFYFHGAKAGRKYELARTEPYVGFEIDGSFSLLPSGKACDYSARYQSVIGNGTLSVVKDNDERIKGLNCLMRQLTGKSGFDYSDEMLNSAAVFKLEVTKLSCKAKM